MAFHSLHDSYCCIVVPSHPRRVTRLTPPARTTLVSQPSCHLAPQPGKVSPCPCLEKRPPPPPRKVFASYTLSLLFQDKLFIFLSTTPYVFCFVDQISVAFFICLKSINYKS
ncbi:unnamed protein product [Cuscuta epithymum]|uniref:Uncharacterized protein n=1 Tax=Cuscuta epithymum TaxID=186058 RepID=A0AAV0FQA9_9ASTE|nr:unnamed protein product [Cuscuta epithymum]